MERGVPAITVNAQDTPSASPPHLAVVGPVHNEAGNLAPLLAEIRAAVAPLGRPWEVVFVDDCSTDGSLEELLGLRAEYPELRVLRLSGRSGQTAALEAGLRATRANFIATLDTDGQNDPRDIPALLERVERGECDLANGWRKDRRDPWVRRVSTRVANGVRNALTAEAIRDSACGFRVMRREVAESFKLFNGMHRFLPTLARLAGFRVIEVPVRHRPRVRGKAKYGVWNRLFRALRDTFAVRWMRSRFLRYEVRELGGEDA